MGVCCFAPKKTEFLWWYWLLLASVVGIPMFLAALYVARKADSEEQKSRISPCRARLSRWDHGDQRRERFRKAKWSHLISNPRRCRLPCRVVCALDDRPMGCI